MMKVAVVGSRNLTVKNLGAYLPEGTTEIVSGGAKGVDACARAYAQENGIPLREFLPDYERYQRAAPLKRNLKIVQYADVVVAFWDGRSRGTRCVLEACKKSGTPCRIIGQVGDELLLKESGWQEIILAAE